MRRLLQAAGIAALSLPAILVVCWPDSAKESASADSSRRRGPPPDPTAILRREPLAAADLAEGRELLRRMQTQWKKSFDEAMKIRGGCGWRPPERFAREWGSTTTEVRLFSLGYPVLAERWAAEALDVPEGPRGGPFQWSDAERYRAYEALGTLWQQGWRGAESVLLRRCRARVPEIFGSSLHLLASGDRSGEHLPLYRERAREGDYNALHVIASWNDAESRAILDSIASNPKVTPWGSDLHASKAMELLPWAQALASEAWDPLVRSTVLDEGMERGPRFYWALRIALERRPTWLEQTLRARLLRKGPEYDDILIALAQTGAELTEAERALLHRHGYLGDPRARLLEVLEEKIYPH